MLTGTILSLNSMQIPKREARRRRRKKEKERKLQPERSDRKRTPTPGSMILEGVRIGGRRKEEGGVITGAGMRRGWEGPLTTASPASKDDLQNVK